MCVYAAAVFIVSERSNQLKSLNIFLGVKTCHKYSHMSEKWMDALPDNVGLTSISIPGTHNSGACYRTIPTVRCQEKSVTDQLYNGVRFIDLRVGKSPMKNEDDPTQLTVVHGKLPVRIPKSRKFYKTLDEIYDFLASNPSECVILSLKVEGVGDWDEEHDEFPELLWDYYITGAESRWYLETKLPTIGEARGKIVLMRRFPVNDKERSLKFGFDASTWEYNTPSDDNGHFVVQDKCELLNKEEIDVKIDLIKTMVENAVEHNSSQGNDKLFLNFTSATNFLHKTCWPENVAKAVASSDIFSNFKKGCGVVIFDYVNFNHYGLAKAVIKSNFDQ